MTDAGFARLKNDLPLKDWTLRIVNVEMSEERVECVKACPSLTRLFTFSGNLTDAELDRLHRVAHLRELRLEGPKVTDAAATRLAKALPMCKVVVNNKTITP